MPFRLEGMIAAVFTPMREDGSLDLKKVPAAVDRLADAGVDGLFACGSTGEGPSLASDERRAVAEAYVTAARGRMKAVVHVGHASLAEAQRLAAHAAEVGADAIAAAPPSYFRPGSVDVLLECIAQVAAGAPGVPFYYYHIPGITGVDLDMVELIEKAPKRMPSFAGIKYTAPTVDLFQAAVQLAGGRLDVLFGRDEMLLSGLAAGARGMIGSTYNFAAPLYHKLIEAFQQGDMETARKWQAKSVAMIHPLVTRYRALPGLKAMMKLTGPDLGPVRLPLLSLTDAEESALRAEMEALGFFGWV